jgi:hypothetical protein
MTGDLPRKLFVFRVLTASSKGGRKEPAKDCECEREIRCFFWRGTANPKEAHGKVASGFTTTGG